MRDLYHQPYLSGFVFTAPEKDSNFGNFLEFRNWCLTSRSSDSSMAPFNIDPERYPRLIPSCVFGVELRVLVEVCYVIGSSVQPKDVSQPLKASHLTHFVKL